MIPSMTPGARHILTSVARKETPPYEEGVVWVSGPVCEELHGWLTIETVTNPDGSPGGGAYYYDLNEAGWEVVDRLRASTRIDPAARKEVK